MKPWKCIYMELGYLNNSVYLTVMCNQSWRLSRVKNEDFL
jgi:hypothetical protein